MTAPQVASQRALPKELPQRVQLLQVLPEPTFQFEPDTLFKR
jgi:hypothetical protein